MSLFLTTSLYVVVSTYGIPDSIKRVSAWNVSSKERWARQSLHIQRSDLGNLSFTMFNWMKVVVEFLYFRLLLSISCLTISAPMYSTSTFITTSFIQLKSPQGASNIDFIANSFISFGNCFRRLSVYSIVDPGPLTLSLQGHNFVSYIFVKRSSRLFNFGNCLTFFR